MRGSQVDLLITYRLDQTYRMCFAEVVSCSSTAEDGHGDAKLRDEEDSATLDCFTSSSPPAVTRGGLTKSRAGSGAMPKYEYLYV